jgi:hypothetical protein
MFLDFISLSVVSTAVQVPQRKHGACPGHLHRAPAERRHSAHGGRVSQQALQGHLQSGAQAEQTDQGRGVRMFAQWRLVGLNNGRTHL